MTYCTKQNMIDRFTEDELIRLTDRPLLLSINDAVLNPAIADAEAEIDSYLSRYPLPLATVPTVLIRLSCDIARYYLYDDQATEQVTRRYDAAVKFLLAVSKGQINLGTDANGTATASENFAQMQSEGHVFARTANNPYARY